MEDPPVPKPYTPRQGVVEERGTCPYLGYGLSEQIPCALQLCTAVPLNKVRQVRLPNVLDVRVLEQRHTLLVHSEGFFPELVLLRGPPCLGFAVLKLALSNPREHSKRPNLLLGSRVGPNIRDFECPQEEVRGKDLDSAESAYQQRRHSRVFRISKPPLLSRRKCRQYQRPTYFSGQWGKLVRHRLVHFQQQRNVGSLR